MKALIREAVQLFEEVMFHGTEHVIEAMEGNVWREYSREQLQLLKLLDHQLWLGNWRKNKVSIKARSRIA